mgnify:CR=1 FL=1
MTIINEKKITPAKKQYSKGLGCDDVEGLAKGHVEHEIPQPRKHKCLAYLDLKFATSLEQPEVWSIATLTCCHQYSSKQNLDFANYP